MRIIKDLFKSSDAAEMGDGIMKAAWHRMTMERIIANGKRNAKIQSLRRRGRNIARA